MLIFPDVEPADQLIRVNSSPACAQFRRELKRSSPKFHCWPIAGPPRRLADSVMLDVVSRVMESESRGKQHRIDNLPWMKFSVEMYPTIDSLHIG